MKSVKLKAAGCLFLDHDPEPTPGPGDILLSISAVGICGSDLHWFGEGGIGDSRLDRPLILGHEFSGVVQTGDHRGERVAVDPAITCGTCRYCQDGKPNLCDNIRFAGHAQQDGALRERLAWPTNALFPIPDALSDADAVMLEPLGVAIHAVRLAQLSLGMRVGVFGCGPVGLLIIQLARLSGVSQIIATDRLSHRLDAARSIGATHVFQVEAGESDHDILSASGGDGVDVAFETAGDQAATDTAVFAARPGSRIVLVGIPPDDRTTFTASLARRKELDLQLCRRMRFTYPQAIQLVASGLVDVRTLVTHHFPLEDYEKAFATAQRREGLKIVIEPNR